MEHSQNTSVSSETKLVLSVAGLSIIFVALYAVYAAIKLAVAGARALNGRKGVSKVKATAKPDVLGVHQNGDPKPTKEQKANLKSLIKQDKAARAKKGVSREEAAAHHELFINTLKDHTDVVWDVAWSPDGRSILTACDDMHLRWFVVDDLTARNMKFQHIRVTKPPVGVGFGDTDTVVALLREVGDVAKIAMYEKTEAQLGGSTWAPIWEVPEVHGKASPLALTTIPMAQSVGRGAIISLSHKKDGQVLDMRGNVLGSFAVNALENHDLAVSLDGRFIAVASFNADVKIWELEYARETRNFRGVSRAMDLKGHSSQVMCCAIRPDCQRAVTVSKDHQMILWNINVRYSLQEDPKKLVQVGLKHLPRLYHKVAYGPHGIIAAAYDGYVHFLREQDLQLVESIDAHDQKITAMQWSPVSRPLGGGKSSYVLLTSSLDKKARLWRSPENK